MGQELGRALVNFGKPPEENVESCAYIAETQTEFIIPAQCCETQQCCDEDQGTSVAEEGKEKIGVCSESVVLQTDDSKIAQILRRKQENNCATEDATNSSVTGHCYEDSPIKKEVCVTSDLLDLKDTASNCKDVQSKFVDENIQENGAKQLIKNNKSKHSTKDEARRKKKLRSIVVLKNEPVRKHRKEHGWSNWEGGWGKHKNWKSQSNSKLSDVRESISSYKQERSERHTAKYKANIHCGTLQSCKQIRNYSHSDICRVNRRNSPESLLCSSRSNSGSPAQKTKTARKQYTKGEKREWKFRDRDDAQAIEQESGIYVSHSRRKNLKLDEMPRRHSSHKRSHSSSDGGSSKNGRRLKCHRERCRKTGIKSVSTEHDLYAYQNHIDKSLVRGSATPESSCFTVESSDCSELRHDSDGKQKRKNLGVESQRKINLKGKRMSSNRKNTDPVCYRFDTKVLKERKKKRMHEQSLVSQLKSSSRKCSSEIKRSPHLIYKSRDKSLDHSSTSCLSDKVTMGKSSSNFKTRSVESNLNMSTLKSKQTHLNAPLTNIPVFRGIPPVPQESPIPPPVLTNSLSSAFSPKDLNHTRENLGIQVRPRRFGMGKQDSMLVDLQDNRKFYEVPHQKKHTLSTSFEDTKVSKVTNRASDQLPNMFDLQIQLLNLSHALSLALPPPVAPLISKVPRNLQQDILRQLVSACTLLPPQRPRIPGISTWNNPLCDWDAPSPYSDELVSFSPPLVKDIDSREEVNKMPDNQKKSSTDFDQQTSRKKNSNRKKWENNDRLKKTVEAVKEVVLPLYSKRKITKDEYKQVMRVVVPKVFHCQTDFSRDSIDRHVQLCVPDVLAARSNAC